MDSHRHDEHWNRLSLDEKLQDLHSDIGKLYSIVESLSHQDHVFVDAMHLVHSKLDSLTKTIEKMQKKTRQPELTE